MPLSQFRIAVVSGCTPAEATARIKAALTAGDDLEHDETHREAALASVERMTRRMADLRPLIASAEGILASRRASALAAKQTQAATVAEQRIQGFLAAEQALKVRHGRELTSLPFEDLIQARLMLGLLSDHTPREG